MQDAEYVSRLLKTDYRTHLPDENPYPDLKNLISRTDFDFEKGEVLGQLNNGKPNRDGRYYQFFPSDDKRILVHRFIVAVALGKWPPRDLDVHHLNSKPDDNRPVNLELVTRRDNNTKRRAPLKDVVDLATIKDWLQGIPKDQKQKPKGARRKHREDTLNLPPLPPTPHRSTTSGRSSEEVLKAFYTIPDDVAWTGRRKAQDGCYHEATTGIWYYVDPGG